MPPNLRATAGRGKAITALSFLLALTYLAFSLPSIGHVPPTLDDSSTTANRWAFVNITSSEPLNQSLLEWGNSTGYSNFSMLNASPLNWYLNKTDLADGTYNYTVLAQNTTGGWNQTRRRFVTVDTTRPSIAFADPTPPNGNTTTTNWVYINTTISDASNTTAFIDWNRSLVGWWRFNREAGENLTFFRDWSTWVNNGTCSGSSCPSAAAGKFGNALQFDGSNDYVDAGNGSSLRVSEITITLWIYLRNITVTSPFVYKGGNTGNYDYQFDYAPSYNPGRIEFWFGNGTSYDGLTMEKDITANSWHFLAVTYNGSHMKFYYDAETSTATSTKGLIAGGTDNLKIGTNYFNTAFTNGTIDDVRIYRRALSIEEINATYAAGIYGLYHNFANLQKGAYNHTAYAEDLAGNVNQTETRAVTVPFTIDAVSPRDQTYTKNWVWANVYLNSPGSWCGVSLNGAANQTLSNTSTTAWYLNLSVPSDGSNNVQFWCNATSGEAVTSPTIYFVTDTTITGTPLNLSGNTSIYDDTVWSNKNYAVNGAIIIYDGGNLTLANTTLTFNNSYSRQYYLDIRDTGSLRVINNSKITTLNSSHMTYIRTSQYTTSKHHLEFRDSTFENGGDDASSQGQYAIEGSYLDGASIIENSVFVNSTGALKTSTDSNGNMRPRFNNNAVILSIGHAFSHAITYYGSGVGGDITNNTFDRSAAVGKVFQLQTDVNGVVIGNNRFYNASDPTTYTIDVYGGNARDITIRDNYFENTKRSIVLNVNQQNITIENNVYNVTDTAIASLGIIVAANYGIRDVIVRNNTAYNTTDNGISGSGVYGSNNSNWLVENNSVHDISGYASGIAGAFQNSRFVNNYFSAKQMNLQYGLHMPLTSGQSAFDANNTYINNTFERFQIGIKTNNSVNITFADTKLVNNSNYDIYFDGNNSGLRFINTQFNRSKVYFADNKDALNNYYYADILVQFSNGTPVSGATITITNLINASYPPINRKGDDTTAFTTGADGHTKLPIGNDPDTVVLMAYARTNFTQQNMTYTAAASFGSSVNSTNLTVDASWYRTNPNTYQNTTVIVLQTIESTTVYVNDTFDRADNAGIGPNWAGDKSYWNITNGNLTKTQNIYDKMILVNNSLMPNASTGYVVEIRSGSKNGFSAIIYAQNMTHFYEIRVADDANQAVRLFRYGNDATVDSIPIEQNSWHAGDVLKVVAKENQPVFTIYQNGAYLGTLRDTSNTFASGRAGIGYKIYYANEQFDSFSAYKFNDLTRTITDNSSIDTNHDYALAQNTVWRNIAVTMNGSIIVPDPFEFTLDNVTLYFTGNVNMTHYLNVNGGILVTDNGTYVAPAEGYETKAYVGGIGKVRIANSIFWHLGAYTTPGFTYFGAGGNVSEYGTTNYVRNSTFIGPSCLNSILLVQSGLNITRNHFINSSSCAPGGAMVYTWQDSNTYLDGNIFEGNLISRLGIYQTGSSGIRIVNNYFTGVWDYTIDTRGYLTYNAYLANNTIINSQKPIVFFDTVGAIVENNVINLSDPARFGSMGWATYMNNTIFRNNVVYNADDCFGGQGSAVDAQSYNNTLYNHLCTNVRDDGIAAGTRNGAYYNIDMESIGNGVALDIQFDMGNSNNTYTNITARKFAYGLNLRYTSNSLFRDINATGTTLDIQFLGNNSNNKFINYAFNPAKVSFADNNDVFEPYWYPDVYVIDSSNSTVGDLQINLANEANASKTSIDRNGMSKTAFLTKSDGHTYKPIENDPQAVALLDYSQTNVSRTNYTYTISAYDPVGIWTGVPHTIHPNGTIQQLQPLSQATGVDPDPSWYRQDPRTPTATINLTILHARTNLTVNSSASLNLTVQLWNLTRPTGQALASFTAASSGTANFTISGLNASKLYSIIRDGTSHFNGTGWGNWTYALSTGGSLSFWNSQWSERTFTLQEFVSGYDNDTQQYWVRTDGNDTCTGQNNVSYGENSTGCAWRTITKAASTLSAGQTGRIQAGTYNQEYAVFSNAGNSTHWINLTGDGSPVMDGLDKTGSAINLNNRSYLRVSGLHIKNYNLGIRGDYDTIKVRLDAFTIENTSGSALDFDSSEITDSILRDFTIFQTGSDGSPTVSHFIYSGSGCRNITITNFTIRDTYAEAINWRDCDGVYISNGSIYNVAAGDGVHLQLGVNNSIVEGMWINNTQWHGIAVHDHTVGTYPLYNNIIRNNYVGYAGHNDIDLHSGAFNTTVENNILTGTPATGQGVYFHNLGAGVVIRNNTIFGTGDGIDGGPTTGQYLRDVLVENNTLYDLANGIMWQSTTENILIRNNKVYNTSEPMHISCCNVTIANNNISGGTYRLDSGAGTLSDPQDSQYYARAVYGGNLSLYYTTGKVFKTELTYNSTGGYDQPRWCPGRCNITLRSEPGTNGITLRITSYPLTAAPTSGYLNITVNQFNETSDRYNLTIASNESENPTWLNLTVRQANNWYTIKRDGTPYSNLRSGSDNVLRLFYNDTGADWSAHTFEFSPSISVLLLSPPGSYLTNNASLIFNCSAASENNLTNMTLYGNWSGWHANETKLIGGASNSTSFSKLLPDGEYAWNCLSYDTTGNSSFAPANRSFRVDTRPPVLSSLNASATTTAATISWNTSEPSNATVRYGPTANMTLNKSSSTLSPAHSFSLEGLSPSTFYYYLVQSCDAAGNCNSSLQYNFTTSAQPPETPSGGGGSPGGSGGAVAAPSKTKRVLSTQLEPILAITVNLNKEATSPSLFIALLPNTSLQPPPGIVYQYLSITPVNFNSSDIQNITVEFKVNRSWISRNGVSSIGLWRHSNGWAKARTEKTNETATQNIYSAYPPAFSYFAIAGETAGPSGTEPATPSNPPAQPAGSQAPEAASPEQAAQAEGQLKAVEKTALFTIMLILAAVLAGCIAYNYYAEKPRKRP